MVKVSVTPFNIVSSYLISNIFVVKSSNSVIHYFTFKYHQPSRSQVPRIIAWCTVNKTLNPPIMSAIQKPLLSSLPPSYCYLHRFVLGIPS